MDIKDFTFLEEEIRKHFGETLVHDQSEPKINKDLLIAAGFTFDEPPALTGHFILLDDVTRDIRQWFETNPNTRISMRSLMEKYDISNERGKEIIRILGRDLNITREYGSYLNRTVPVKFPTQRNKKRNPIPSVQLHPYAVILYELFTRNSETVNGRTIVRASTEDILRQLPSTDRERFLFRGKISRSTIIQTHQYLVSIGSIEIAGPIKALLMHPDDLEGGVADRLPTAPASEPEPTPLRTEMTTTPMPEQPDLIGQVNPDHLAHAIANGMWTRFEWALGEVGELRERIAQMEEGMRVKDEEIARLRSLSTDPDVIQIARQLLS